MRGRLFFLSIIVCTFIQVETYAADKLDTFTLSRYACEGTCPAYEVKLSSDGSIEYTGVRFVDVMGKRYFKPSYNPYQDVKKMFTKLWIEAQKVPECDVYDSQTVSLHVDEGGFNTEFYLTRACGWVTNKGDLWAEINKLEKLIPISELVGAPERADQQ